MTFQLNQRTFVRILSFSISIIIVILTYMGIMYNSVNSYKLKIEYSYLRSINDLTEYINNISNTLKKTMYVGTPEMLSDMSSNLWRESSGAKNSLAQLPVDSLNLGETYKFLSQVGEYSRSISSRVSQGKTITDDQRENLVVLSDFSNKLSENMIALQDAIQTGSISFEKVNQDISNNNNSPPAPKISDGFNEFQESFTSYPKLIYDGPFSDHILEKESEKIANLPEVSRQYAKEKAAIVANIDINTITDSTDEEGKMPSYGFKTDTADISITKQGGLVSYMLDSSVVEFKEINNDQAYEIANNYLISLGVYDMMSTYHEISDNVITINYASAKDDIVFYTDLIKVSIAMDDGRVVGFDARGYIMNNKERSIANATLSQDQALKSVSPQLSVESVRLAVVPSNNIEEVLAYEFMCKSESGDNILVYVNAYTGREEDVFILAISENGVLTI